MANEAKHTAGPWSVHIETEQHRMYRGPSAVYICNEAGWPEGQIARVNVQDGLHEREANAYLIASVPELLAAAIRVRARCQSMRLDADANSALDDLSAAIDKASGAAQ